MSVSSTVQSFKQWIEFTIHIRNNDLSLLWQTWLDYRLQGENLKAHIISLISLQGNLIISESEIDKDGGRCWRSSLEFNYNIDTICRSLYVSLVAGTYAERREWNCKSLPNLLLCFTSKDSDSEGLQWRTKLHKLNGTCSILFAECVRGLSKHDKDSCKQNQENLMQVHNATTIQDPKTQLISDA